jgi:hypothetical protein
MDASAAERFVGSYTLDPATAKASQLPQDVQASIQTIALTPEGTHLRFTPNGQRPLALFLGADGVLFTKQHGFTLEPAHAAGFTLKQGSLSLRYTRSRATK